MGHTFSSIDEYIAGFDAHSQHVLERVRQVVRKAAPPDAKETISYQMPTFRWNGNLIHFAMNKNHLGLYPGPAAIEAFARDLESFRTSKGAIQIPLDGPLPERLIASIVRFNVERLKDKKSPDWGKYRSKWTECNEFMARLISMTPLKKEFKWGNDIYTYTGKHVVGWAGFKDFFSLWFYNGVFLEDKEGVLVNASEGKTKALRQWRFTDVNQMDEKKILAYIEESIQAVKDGKEIEPQKTANPPLEGLLKLTLDTDKPFRQAFERLTPGRQREYIGYIAEAKQEKTKKTRLAKIRPLVLVGKGLHDKYRGPV